MSAVIEFDAMRDDIQTALAECQELIRGPHHHPVLPVVETSLHEALASLNEADIDHKEA